MPFGLDYRILLSGDIGEAQRWVPTGRSWANRLELLLPEDPFAKKFRLTELVRMEIQCLPGTDRWIHIHAEPPCENFPGGFLQYRNEHLGGAPGKYWIVYSDGKEAIVGQPEGPDLDTQLRAQDVELTEQPFGSDPRHPHFYTGRIRIAVQCEHLLGKTTALLHHWTRSHGVYDPNPEPEPFDPAHPEDVDMDAYIERSCHLIEISSDGVYSYPIDWTGRCCDSLDYSDLLPTDEEVEATPLALVFRTQLSLKWAMDNGREGVHQMATAGDVQDIFTPYSPWYAGQAWAFSYSGKEAQNIGSRQKSDRYLTSRFKFRFQYDENKKVVEMTRSTPTADATCTFWKAGASAKSVFWVPDLSDPLGTTWDAVAPYDPLPCTDSPFFVYYEGELERIATFSYATVGAHTDTDADFTSPPAPFKQTGNLTNCSQIPFPGPTYYNQYIGELVVYEAYQDVYGTTNTVTVGINGFKTISGTEGSYLHMVKRREEGMDYVANWYAASAPAVLHNDCHPAPGAIVQYTSKTDGHLYLEQATNTNVVKSILTHCAAMPDRESFGLFKHDSEVGTPGGGFGVTGGTIIYLLELLDLLMNIPNGPTGASVHVNANQHKLAGSSAGNAPADIVAQTVAKYDLAHLNDRDYLRKNYSCSLLGRGTIKAEYSTTSSDPLVAYNVVDTNLRPFYLYTTTNTRVQSPISLIQSGLREANNYFHLWDVPTIGLVQGYPVVGLSQHRRHFFLGRQ